MSEIKNILSIDFDKFLTKELDIKSENKNKIRDYNEWLRSYLKNRDYFNISIKKKELNQILSLIFKLDVLIKILVADSHSKIVNMFSDITKDLNDINIKYNIYNVDHHHDICYGNNWAKEEFTCANWVSHLFNLNKINEYVWICNEDSLQYNSNYPIKEFSLTSDLNVLNEVKFDAIFICKSSSWIPLHLQYEFDKFISVIGLKLNLIFTNESFINPLLNSNNLNKSNIQDVINLYDSIELKKGEN